MRIVVVGPTYPFRGGIAHHTTLLARALAERHEVELVSFRRQYPRWWYPGQSDRDPSRQPLRAEAEYCLEPLSPSTWWQTANRISAFKPDLVVIPWWTTFWAPAFTTLAHMLRRRSLATLFLIHNVLPHEPRRLDVWLARLALSRGQAFIVQSEREKARLLSLLPNACVEICAHPLYEMFARAPISKAEARRHLGLPEALPLVLFFGIVRPYKGLKYLIEAIAQLQEQGEAVDLLVAGEFWDDPAAYLRQIERLKVRDRVHLSNRYIPNEEVAWFFSAADLFVAPYVGGTQSGALKLAQGFGIPSIATESICDGGVANGAGNRLQVVPPADAQMLAEAIRRAVRSQPTAADLTSFKPAGARWIDLVETVEKSVRHLNVSARKTSAAC